MDAIIVARNLVKRYGALAAVAGISFEVFPKDCFGLVGPNGAGKTTTISMMCAVSPQTGGELVVDGKDVRAFPREVKQVLGVVPQEDDLDTDLNVEMNLLAHARYHGVPDGEARRRVEETLELAQLVDRRRSEVHHLSGGMKRRLVIARALMTRPKILIVDEPTLGLDPHNRHRIWDWFRDVQRQGTTVVLSTNNMDEAVALCNRVIIIDHGRILSQGAPQELVQEHVGDQVLEVRLPAELRATLQEQLAARGLPVYEAGSALVVPTSDGHALAQELNASGATAFQRAATLEDVFLRLTGRSIAQEGG
ncbi:MAG: ABC transporter ATP-binding protein [Dehalococcoidia bacterium]|nr:ABC transporter ATP-binding protein [Dehalococcoidia bacterium]